MPVASSFNEQLMNQTNFGYNPARNTLANHENNLDPMSAHRPDRGQLNTQKRNRTSTIDQAGNNYHSNNRGNSLNINELYSHYSQTNGKQAGVAKANTDTVIPTRNGVHAPVNQGAGSAPGGNSGDNGQQLFLPGTMKLQMANRIKPVTQHQQHSAHS